MTTGPDSGGPAGSAAGTFCGHCGKPVSGGLPASGTHERCGGLLALEPPRYCAHCMRRMKVQVTPTGWSAECSRHGVLNR